MMKNWDEKTVWENKGLKKKAKGALKKHYWKLILICFVAAYVTGAYAYDGTTNLIVSYNPNKAVEGTIDSNLQENKTSNTEIMKEIVNYGETGNNAVKESEGQYEYTRGVLASIVNNATDSGSIVLGVVHSLNQGIFKGDVLRGIVLLIGSLLSVGFWFFVSNAYKVCQSRYFLESAVYKVVKANRMMYIVGVRKWCNVAKIMFFRSLYGSLWWLTIVGGVVKQYSYKMMPYIVAENPAISKKEAFRLSMEMMKGNKWKSFKLDLSFAGWWVLSMVTGGIVAIFFLNPYYTATETQLYMVMREKARREQRLYSQRLNDDYIGLYPAFPKGETVLPQAYPVECFSLPEHARRKWIKVDYKKDYSVWSLILLFFTFSLIGWLWEVSLHLSTDGFVNRGVMQGPWLPIYGSGGVLVLVLLKKVREHPLVTFTLTVVICGILEYGTSLFLEVTQGKKWWDYSGYLLNINGRVCAEGLLVFGLGGCAFIYFAAPLFDQLYRKIPVKRQMLLCIVLLTIFMADYVYSQKHPNVGKGITDYDEKAWNVALKHPNRRAEIIRNS